MTLSVAKFYPGMNKALKTLQGGMLINGSVKKVV